MTLAIIRTGGKQYLIKKGDKIKIEKLEEEKGKEVNFTDVLLVQDNKKVEIGKPIVKGVKVVGKILEQGKGKKIIVYKYNAKKRYSKKAGYFIFFQVAHCLKCLRLHIQARFLLIIRGLSGLFLILDKLFSNSLIV